MRWEPKDIIKIKLNILIIKKQKNNNRIIQIKYQTVVRSASPLRPQHLSFCNSLYILIILIMFLLKLQCICESDSGIFIKH